MEKFQVPKNSDLGVMIETREYKNYANSSLKLEGPHAGLVCINMGLGWKTMSGDLTKNNFQLAQTKKGNLVKRIYEATTALLAQ